jgi:hypothetical protein
LFEACLVFSSQLGELNSITKVAEACYDNAFGAHLDVIDPEPNVQLRAYVQREHHLYETTAEGEISDFWTFVRIGAALPSKCTSILTSTFFRGCCLRSCPAPPPDDSVTFKWFVKEKYLPICRGRWRTATREKTEHEIKKYLVDKFKDVPLRNIGLFELQTRLNDLAGRRNQDASDKADRAAHDDSGAD